MAVRARSVIDSQPCEELECKTVRCKIQASDSLFELFQDQTVRSFRDVLSLRG